VIVTPHERRSESTDAARFNVRTRVHEYGGTPYALSRGADLLSNFSDQAPLRATTG